MQSILCWGLLSHQAIAIHLWVTYVWEVIIERYTLDFSCAGGWNLTKKPQEYSPMKNYHANYILIQSFRIGAISLKFGGMYVYFKQSSIVSNGEKVFERIAAFLLRLSLLGFILSEI